MKINFQIGISLVCIAIMCCNSPFGNAESASVSESDSAVTAPGKTVSQPQFAEDSAIKAKVKIPDYNQVIGDWIRTDGGKTIRINGASPDGNLNAEYFNPNPIHVGQAEWILKNNRLVVIVELQDVNYPGSRYTLEFFPAEEKLAGIYYQAVDKENYEVEFIRQK
jgi:hypothetical protein